MEKELTKRQKRAQETRAKIIDAAREMLVEKGFDEISVEEITDRAGVSTGSFYTYFRRKEDVIEALNDYSGFMKLAETANGLTDADVCERLKMFCSKYLNIIEAHGAEICRQWIRNSLLTAQKNTVHGEGFYAFDHDIDAVGRILTEAVKRRELIPETPVRDLSLFICAELYGLQTIWCSTDTSVNAEDEVKKFCDTVLEPVMKKYTAEVR